MTAPKSAAELSKIWRHNNVPPSDNTGPIDHYADKASLAGHAAGRESAGAERDAYAKAMAIALREGIFASKADTKRKITEVLTSFKALAGVGE